MKPLKVNPEYKAMVPRPSAEDYRALETDIILKGKATEPIVINKDDVILDGHTRYDICRSNGCFFTTRLMEFDNQLDEKLYVLTTNLYRRHLNDFKKVEMAKPLERLLKEKAKNRMIEGGKGASFEEPLHVNEEVSKLIGVSKSTYERAKKVRDEGDFDLKTRVRSGDLSITAGYRQLVKPKHDTVLCPELPDGEFNVIYADPPWRYNFSETETRSIEVHYPTMSVEDICKLEIPSAENAVLFLWSTAPKLPEALEVMATWGFTYKTQAVWDKEIIGMGYWFRGQHELLLVGTKGNFSPPLEKLRRSSILRERRTTHSTKPETVYDIIESYFPSGKYLELFSRNHRLGWTMWGNETPDTYEAITPVNEVPQQENLGFD